MDSGDEANNTEGFPAAIYLSKNNRSTEHEASVVADAGCNLSDPETIGGRRMQGPFRVIGKISARPYRIGSLVLRCGFGAEEEPVRE